MTALLVSAVVCAAVLVLAPSAPAGRMRRLLRSGPGPAPSREAHAADVWRRSPRGRLPVRTPSPLLLELVAALLDAGAPPQRALGAVGVVLESDGDPRGAPLQALAADLLRPDRVQPEARTRPAADAAGTPEPVVAGLEEVLRLAARTGLPPVDLVRRAAVEERRRADAEHRRAVRRLEVHLVLPVGLCLLPAFVLLGVVPIVVDLLGG